MNLKYSCLLASLMASSAVAFAPSTSIPTSTRLMGLADDDIESAIDRAVSLVHFFPFVPLQSSCSHHVTGWLYF
jgi:hypothetical protein